MLRQAYPVTDAEWTIREPLVPAPLASGRSPRHERREIVSAILYVLYTGRQWRALPHDLPPLGAVWCYVRRWREEREWERINSDLRERSRDRVGREPTPYSAILDCQTVKTTKMGAARLRRWEEDPPGRNRHLLVDTDGTVMKTRVEPAEETDAEGAKPLLTGWPRSSGVSTCFGSTAATNGGLPVGHRGPGWRVEAVQHPEDGVRVIWVGPGHEPPVLATGFRVLPRRWVVERTFVWVGRNCLLTKDYEALPASA